MLIIGAALAVPWHRMEQLTEELNGRAAAALAENAIVEHVLAEQSPGNPDLTTTRPSPEAKHILAEQDQPLTLPPYLISIDAKLPGGLTHFEQRAINHFIHHPDDRPYAATSADGQRYLYAHPVYMTEQCAACHANDAAADKTLPASVIRSRLLGIVSIDIPSRVRENQLLLNRVFIMVAGLLGGTLAILCFYLITTRLILQPVRVLQETAEKVSEGDLNIRSDISTGDEFQQLSETFNIMLANLKQSADQLRAINTGLDLKLGQLAEANLALYESNRLKSEFLANVSHELRTPLNSILGFADLLKDALAGTPDAKPARYVHNILQSGRALLELINDLLDLAKIEAGRMEVRAEPLSLGDLFEGLCNILRPLYEPKRLEIEPSVAANVPILQTDPGKLQQVLYNFLSNAIKFSPTNATIELSASRSDKDRVRIAVTDHGPGIPEDKQQVIFEKFRQVDASVTRTHGGSGLGLAISKELTAMMGGKIGVQSAPDRGSTFWIDLPLKIQPTTLDVREKLVLS